MFIWIRWILVLKRAASKSPSGRLNLRKEMKARPRSGPDVLSDMLGNFTVPKMQFVPMRWPFLNKSVCETPRGEASAKLAIKKKRTGWAASRLSWVS